MIDLLWRYHPLDRSPCKSQSNLGGSWSEDRWSIGGFARKKVHPSFERKMQPEAVHPSTCRKNHSICGVHKIRVEIIIIVSSSPGARCAKLFLEVYALGCTSQLIIIASITDTLKRDAPVKLWRLRLYHHTHKACHRAVNVLQINFFINFLSKNNCIVQKITFHSDGSGMKR